MKTLITIVFSLLYIANSAQTPSNDPHWQLVWGDDFNFFDNHRWVKGNYATHGNPKQEPQLYMEKNVFTRGGELILAMRKEKIVCPGIVQQTIWSCDICKPGEKFNYTSGWVELKKKNYVKFGYIEARIAIPYGKGFWPAFWTWTGGPPYQEIDIFEMVPGAQEWCPLVVQLSGGYFHNYNHMTSNMHNGATGIPWCVSNYKVTKVQDYRGWHDYAIEWSPSKIIFYLDGSPFRVLPNDSKMDPTRLILNFALNPHDFDPNKYDYAQNKSIPAEMRIDYVNYYKLNNDCDKDLTICSYNFNTHDNKVKKTITIGNGSCSNSLQIGDDVYLRASEGVLIKGDFEVPVGSELYIDVDSCYE